MIAQIGRPLTAAVAEAASTATSVAVSNPRANRKERIHVPALADQPEQWTEQACEQAPAVEHQIEILGCVARALAHGAGRSARRLAG
jgi:hypothetical protein